MALLALMTCHIPSAMAEARSGLLSDIFSTRQEASVHGHGMVPSEQPDALQRMQDNGITLEAIYTGEAVRKFSGGLNKQDSVYHDNLDLSISMDTEKLLSWPGGTLFIYGLRDHGGSPSGDLGGDLQGFSNIEAPDQFIIYELWYEQQFANDRASLLFGLHDLNSEFYVSDYAGLFLNSSFGIGPELTANVPASIFPKAGLGIRARVRPLENWYIQGAVYDGDPATRRLKSGEGKMAILESGLSGDTGTYKAGYWQHTANKSYNNQTFSSDYGVYAIIDQQLLHFEGSTAVGAFIQWGWVPKARNDVTGYLGGGLHIQAPLPEIGRAHV